MTFQGRLNSYIGAARSSGSGLDPRSKAGGAFGTGLPYDIRVANGLVDTSTAFGKDDPRLRQATKVADSPLRQAKLLSASQDEQKLEAEKNRQRGRSATILNGGQGLLAGVGTAKRSLIGF